MISVALFKMSKHSDFHLSFFQIVGAWRDFTVSQKWWEILRVYVVLGDAVSRLERFVWILSHIARPITWSLLTLKASYLVKWSIVTWSSMWWCQFIDWLKFETRPSSLLNFGTAYWNVTLISTPAGCRGRFTKNWKTVSLCHVAWIKITAHLSLF